MSNVKGLIVICFCFLFCSCNLFTLKNSGKHDNKTFTDTRDGKTYKTVQIGEQVWMSENLNYETSSGSWCYDDNAENCEKYGRLYNWETAKDACPDGWRLPSIGDFQTLLSTCGTDASERYHAIKRGGSSGFNAFWGGFRLNNNYSLIGNLGSFWSSSERATNFYSYLSINIETQTAVMATSSKGVGFSVRCIKE